MARIPQLLNALRAVETRLWAKRLPFGDGLVGNTVNAPQIDAAWGADNSFEHRFINNAGTDSVRALSVNSGDQVMVAEALSRGTRELVTWEVVDNASIASQGFFVCPAGEKFRVVSISWTHATQSSVAGTAYVEKTPSGTAIGSGTSLMSGTFNLHTIANNTPTAATLSTTNTGDSDNPDLILNPGDQLSVIIAGTITSLAGVQCTVVIAPLGPSYRHLSFYINANADMVQNQIMAIMNRRYNIQSVTFRYSTKSSVSGLKLTLTDDASGTAPGGGTSILTDNSNAGILVTQTANTAYAGTLSANPLAIANGDQLSVAFSGATLTALVGLVITVSFVQTYSDRIEKSFFLDHVVGAATLVGITAVSLWTADRDYEVLDASESHRVAGTDGGTVTLNLGIAGGTTAPSSATIGVITAFNAKSTAATPVFATMGALNTRFILKGQRLCIVPSGTFTTAAGAAITVALRPS